MRFPRASPARRASPASSLAMFLCLPLLLTGCAAPPATSLRQIEPPPADLAEPCCAGPPYPVLPAGGVIPYRQLNDIQEQREAAAAVCRARHDRLVKAWPAAGAPQP